MPDDFGDLGELIIPDVPEPISAWREWDIEWDHQSLELRRDDWPYPVGPESRLVSGFSREPWRPGYPMVARCPYSPAERYQPDQSIDHAYVARWGSPRLFTTPPPPPCEHTPSATADGHQGYGCGIYSYKAFDRFMILAPSFRRVWGRVAVYGEVWEHSLGYRSERAELTGIMVPPMFARPPSGRGFDKMARHDQPVADYLAGLLVLAAIYRVPIIVPRQRSTDRPAPTWAATQMPIELTECSLAEAWRTFRYEWGWQPTTPDERLARQAQQERELKQLLDHVGAATISEESLAELLKMMDRPKGDDDG